MNVTILGAGNMGRAIGTRAAAGGHSVIFVDSSPDTAEKAATEVRTAARNGARVSSAQLADVDLGDVVVLAVWYGTNIELAQQLGTRLNGKVVVDIANPLNASFDGLATMPGSSSAEDLARGLASGATVVKAFNTTYAATLQTGAVAGQPLDVFIAGDDETAKGRVMELVRDGGLRPIDVGPLSRSRQLEGMQFLHIIAQGKLGTNWGSTIKILSD